MNSPESITSLIIINLSAILALFRKSFPMLINFSVFPTRSLRCNIRLFCLFLKVWLF
jgi:hypothetical protein